MKAFLISVLGALILGGVLGFFIGRSNQRKITKTITHYIKERPVTGEIDKPQPVKETTPVNPDIQYVYTTIKVPGPPGKDSIEYRFREVDSAAILKDYIVKRDYNNILFDNDSLGKFTLDASVQYNKMQQIKYKFDPVQKVTINTVRKKNTVEPFVSAGYNTFKYIGIGGGTFIKKTGIEYKYLNNLKGSAGHEITLKQKL